MRGIPAAKTPVFLGKRREVLPNSTDVLPKTPDQLPKTSARLTGARLGYLSDSAICLSPAFYFCPDLPIPVRARLCTWQFVLAIRLSPLPLRVAAWPSAGEGI
jgi:hypothetical protein